MTDPARAAQQLSPLVGTSMFGRLERRLTSGRNFVWLGRRLAPAHGA